MSRFHPTRRRATRYRPGPAGRGRTRWQAGPGRDRADPLDARPLNGFYGVGPVPIQAGQCLVSIPLAEEQLDTDLVRLDAIEPAGKPQGDQDEANEYDAFAATAARHEATHALLPLADEFLQIRRPAVAADVRPAV